MELKIYSEIEIEDVCILDSAIDFHPFPKMLEKILLKVISDEGHDPKTEEIKNKKKLTEKDIKYYIWTFDSNVNYRNVVQYKKEELMVWETIIKPKCNVYRKYIKEFIKELF
jgi:hypothetical protein